MDTSYAELLEQKHLLKNVPKLLGYRAQAAPVQMEPLATGREEQASLEEGATTTQDGKTLRMIAGLLNVENKEALERVAWRVSRGNALVKYADDPCVFTDPNNEVEIEKDCFIILFSGQILQDKLGKLLFTMSASRFAIPDTDLVLARQLSDITRQVEDHIAVKAESVRQQRQLIATYSDEIGQKEMMVMREKAVHDCMNLFNSRISNRTVLAEAWVPKENINDVESALRKGAIRARADTPSVLSVIKTRDTPPTYIKKNKLTEAFQVHTCIHT
jgi:V-type H+-transporting ATPase subunit a